MPHSRYEFNPGAMFSAPPRSARGGVVEVRWMLGLDERLSMDLAPAMVAGLRGLPAAFDRPQFERAIGQRAAAKVILEHLIRRGLVLGHPAGRDPVGGTARRSVSRVVTSWPSPAGRYRIATTSIESPARVVPLAYYGASIDGEWTGFGVSPDPVVAEHIARYEAMERYGVLHPELRRPTTKWPGNLPSLDSTPGVMFDFFRAVAPPASVGDPQERYRLARSVTGRRARGVVPIEWIYLGCSPAANTNGTAFGLTLGSAIESAQRELVERDRLLRGWYGLVPSREITRGLKRYPQIERWRRAALAVGLRARWFQLGDDHNRLATVVCVVGSDEPPHVGSGSATRPDVESASEKAFLEAAGSHLGQVMAAAKVGRQRFLRAALRRAAGPPAAFKRTAFEHYWAARGPDGLAEIASRFSRPRIRAAQSFDPGECLWVDVTPASFERGRVVKVFHPDAVPLPNSMAQVITLEALLGVRGNGTPPPIS